MTEEVGEYVATSKRLNRTRAELPALFAYRRKTRIRLSSNVNQDPAVAKLRTCFHYEFAAPK